MGDVDASDVDEFLAEHGENVTVYAAPTQSTNTLYGSIATNTEATGVTELAFITQIKYKEIQESDGKFNIRDCRGVFGRSSVIAEGAKVQRSNGKLYVVDMIMEGSHDIHHYEVWLKYLRTV